MVLATIAIAAPGHGASSGNVGLCNPHGEGRERVSILETRAVGRWGVSRCVLVGKVEGSKAKRRLMARTGPQSYPRRAMLPRRSLTVPSACSCSRLADSLCLFARGPTTSSPFLFDHPRQRGLQRMESRGPKAVHRSHQGDNGLGCAARPRGPVRLESPFFLCTFNLPRVVRAVGTRAPSHRSLAVVFDLTPAATHR